MQNAYVNHINKHGRLLSLAFSLILSLAAVAQSQVNTAFNSGETLQYDLYYNWRFVWVKAGMASMSTTSTIWHSQPAYRTRLLTRGSDRADNFFVLRDTLTCVVTQDDMLPRYYTKTDLEGEKYRQRYVWFSYKDNTTHVRQKYINPYGNVTWKEEEASAPIYDMLSMLLRARSFDASSYKTGDKIRFLMTDGDGYAEQTLVYRGKETVKLKSKNVSFRCLVMSFVEYEKGKEKEVVRFYVTDDKNHLPVRLDLNLSFGTAKAYLSGYTGVRNPLTSKK